MEVHLSRGELCMLSPTPVDLPLMPNAALSFSLSLNGAFKCSFEISCTIEYPDRYRRAEPISVHRT